MTSTDPVFVVGCGHSGTSLVVRTLSRTGGLWSPQRETNWGMLNTDAECLSALTALERDAAATATAAAPSPRLLEKSPCHDSRLDLIFRLRPAARVIFVVRDPRDVVASRTLPPRSEPARQALRRWIASAGHARKWCAPATADARVLLLRYEDLVGDPATAVTTIGAFVGADVTLAALADPTRPGIDPLAFNGVSPAAAAAAAADPFQSPGAPMDRKRSLEGQRKDCSDDPRLDCLLPSPGVGRAPCDNHTGVSPSAAPDPYPDPGRWSQPAPSTAKDRRHALAERRSQQINAALLDHRGIWRKALLPEHVALIERHAADHMSWLGYT